MLIGKVTCEVCGRQFKAITHTHLIKEHGMSLREYMDLFPDSPLYEEVVSNPEGEKKNLLLDALNRNWNK
jgi:hypothetical protein